MFKTLTRLGALAALLAGSASQATIFKVDWTGIGSSQAIATGLFDFQPGIVTPMNQMLSFGPDASLLSFTLTVDGVTTSYDQSMFRGFYFSAPVALDFSRELVGQAQSGGCTFGSCVGGQGGDFNLFSSSGAPNGYNYFELATQSGDHVKVASMAPLGYYSFNTGVPEAGIWASMILGLGVVGGSLRRRSKQRIALTFA